MTELSFLLDLLLKHKLSKETKSVILERINEIQLRVTAQSVEAVAPKTYTVRSEPSREGDGKVAQIAHTPAAMAALKTRQDLISAALHGKPLPGSDHAPKSHGKL